MWLSEEEYRSLDEICGTDSLTEEELRQVETYRGFKGIKSSDPKQGGLPPALYNAMKDILKKYGANE
jgi:hypothetical protein